MTRVKIPSLLVVTFCEESSSAVGVGHPVHRNGCQRGLGQRMLAALSSELDCALVVTLCILYLRAFQGLNH